MSRILKVRYRIGNSEDTSKPKRKMHDQRKTSAAFALLIQQSVLFIRIGKVIISFWGELNPIPKIF